MSTQLKTVNIKGKEYVEVSERIRYFRESEAFKGYSLISEWLELTDKRAVCLAKILNWEGNIIATGTAYEMADSTFINKTSYIENCETSAWGRALGNLGIGIEGSVRSALEMINADNNQPVYKTQSKQTDEDKAAYWNEFTSICKSLDIKATDFLSEFAEVDLLDKKAMFNAVSKYLKDKDMFIEQLDNYKQFKNNQ